jgi:hypothetical protein
MDKPGGDAAVLSELSATRANFTRAEPPLRFV